MRGILMACGLVAIGVLPLGAQTPAVRQLPPATVARIRMESERLHQASQRGRLPAVLSQRRRASAGAPAAPRAGAANPIFHARPPKSTPAGETHER
jgi:hypothetical protein